MTSLDLTSDDFLGGRLTLNQPAKGYRVTSDSVFLAAALKIKNNDRVLDVGAGTGAILSCLCAGKQELPNEFTLCGIEIQKDLLELADQNADENIKYFEGNLFTNIDGIEPNSFHQVVSNPPVVYPLFSKQGETANRVIIRAQKGAKGLLSLKSGLIVHKSNGEYSEEAENILRHAHELDIEK